MGKKCVVVPLYKKFESLTGDEVISLQQLYNILNKHSVYFAVPASLNTDAYLQHAASHNKEVGVKKFPDRFFSSIKGYNELLLSQKFYEAFDEYEYMLIYQTDAFVFKDELDYWADKGYDYIGAPWFEGWGNTKAGASLIGVGNGGFSLRNIRNSIKILRKFYFAKKVWTFYQSSPIKKIISLKGLYGLLKFICPVNYDQGNFTFVFDGKYSLNEDAIWGHFMPMFFPEFKVAPIKEAIKFSFESHPEELFLMNDLTLPFGCHAWKKWSPDFWSKYIKAVL